MHKLQMHKFRLALTIITIFVFGLTARAQKDTIEYEVETHGIISNGNHAPFWFQNNVAGDVSHEANSAALELRLFKPMNHRKRLFDYSVLLTTHLHEEENKTAFELHEFFIDTRLWIFNLNGGLRKKSHGNQDKTLSGGGLLFSNNGHPIPRIFAGIEEFTPILKNGLVEIKGGIAHGWFTDDVYTKNMLFHHKYAFVRLGGKLPVHFEYGLDHAAQWGGIDPVYGQQSTGFRDFVNVFMARGGSSVSGVSEEQINVGGNHIISQSTRIEYDLSDYKLAAYWQNINEDKPIRPIWNAVNIFDGLWGFSVKNKNFPVVKGFLYEYLNTTDQNGSIHDMDGIVFGGADDYFNNYMYRSGWTHHGRTIGTPFITSPVYNTDGDFRIRNNRTQVHHFGVEGEVSGYAFRVLSSFSKNYGTYHNPYPEVLKSTNLLLEVDKHFEKLWGIDAGISIGADYGKMYGNNAGFMIRFAKSGFLLK